ncbi:MAG: reductive dehalogenase [Desulfovibrio sp.]|nr:reductive dehalogenase [Desulfovibrio sp.]
MEYMTNSRMDSANVERRNAEGLTRRAFIKSTLFGLTATAAVLPNALAAAEEKEAAFQENRARNVTYLENSPLKIQEGVYKRYDSHMTAMNVLSRELGEPWSTRVYANGVQNVLNGKAYTDGPASSVAEARAFRALQCGTDILNMELTRYGHGMENIGQLSWRPLRVPKGLRPEDRPPDETDPKTLTKKIKTMARLVGADLVGIGPVNPNWFYTRIQRNYAAPHPPFITKDITFGDISTPTETDTALIIPSTFTRTIVMGISLNRVFMQTSPSAVANSMAELGYTRMIVAVVGLSEFIRALGYNAIPSMNGTGMSVPMAVEAGLGEVGRHGLLLTPEYGSAQRLCKVYTDMPLELDKPIDFGAVEFCKTCKKCATLCPAKAVSEDDERQWEARTSSNNGAAFKWYNDVMKCVRFWAYNGSTCAVCMAVCPFTKGAAWSHAATRFAIDKMRFADPAWVHLDDAFGFGELRDSSVVWDMDMSTYAMDPKMVRQTKY